MRFLRNREVRTLVITLLAVSALSVAIGFVIGAATGALILAVCAVLCAVFFFFTRRRYADIAYLSERIDTVLHGSGSFSPDSCEEGELSILRSEIYKMSVRLTEQADALRSDKLYLSQSLADIAHQLRTPLTSMNMIASFLDDDSLTPQRRRELSRELKLLLDRTDWLITSLLKISRIDAGTAVFRQGRVDTAGLLKKAAEPLLIPLELRGVSLEVSELDGIWLTGDLDWTAEAVGNILKNCMEHTREGGRIRVSGTQNAVFTELRIEDNGSGIEAEDLPHIFERFYRGKASDGSSFGIGLALCRMIVTSQNGTIRAARLPVGTRFTMRFYHSVV